MLQFYMRLWVALEQLRDRLMQFAARRHSRVGRVVAASVVGLVLAAPAHAEDADPGAGAIDMLFQTLARGAYWFASLLAQGVVLLIGVMTEVIVYNDFSTNKVVSAGWSIVRDTVNMFFVVVLIIIAFGTIFGHSRFQWQQQVPKLMVFALVINFSKTLCGIMIDFGQVIMLTFANAIREIAAGNFIQLLGLGDIYQVSGSSSAIAQAEGFEAFDFFASGMMSVLLMVWVFATLVILTFVLIYRVVMLWVMIVVSPLAWFMGGAGGSGGIISSNAYAQWWDRFKCLVAVGPVLTFFLWLTLAVAGAGNVAASTGFSPSDDNSANFIGKIFEMDRFMSFVIGMAMLYAGFDAAQQFCSSMSGSLLGRSLKKGQGIPAAAAGVGIKVSAAGARKLGGAAGALPKYVPGGAGISNLMDQYSPTRAGARARIYGGIGQMAGNNFAGRYFQLNAAKARAKAAGQQQTRYERAQETFKGVSREDKAAYAKRFMEKGGASTAEGQRELVTLLKDAMGDKELARQMRNDGTLGQLHQQYGSFVKRDFGGDDEMRKKMDTFERDNLDVIRGEDRKKALERITSWDDVESLNADALGQSDVREHLKGVGTRFRDDDGKPLSAAEALAAGYGGKAKQDMYGGSTDAGHLVGAEFGRDIAAGKNTDEIMKEFDKAIDGGDMSRATEIAESLANHYDKAEGPKAGAERFNLAVSMDGMEAKLKNAMEGMRANNASKRQVSRVDAVRQRLESVRGQAEMTAAGNAVGNKMFGEVPDMTAQVGQNPDFSGEAFAERAFGNASAERLADAASQIAEQVKGLEEAVQDIELDDEGNPAGGNDQLTAQIYRLEQQIKNDVQARMKEKSDRMSVIDAQMSSPNTDIRQQVQLRAERTQLEVEINNEIQSAMNDSEELTKLQAQMTDMKTALTEAKKAAEKVAALQEAKRGGDAAGGSAA